MKYHDNLKSSLAKWRKIRRDVARMGGNKDDWKEYWHKCVWIPCGFCVSFSGNRCDNCPLYPKSCSHYFASDTLITKIYKIFKPSKRKEVISLIDELIKEMKKHNERFYEVEILTMGKPFAGGVK